MGKKREATPYFFMTEENKNIVPDLTDMEEVRRAIIAGEIINRKY
jgi:hypothetical protein